MDVYSCDVIAAAAAGVLDINAEFDTQHKCTTVFICVPGHVRYNGIHIMTLGLE